MPTSLVQCAEHKKSSTDPQISLQLEEAPGDIFM